MRYLKAFLKGFGDGAYSTGNFVARLSIMLLGVKLASWLFPMSDGGTKVLDKPISDASLGDIFIISLLLMIIWGIWKGKSE